MSEREITLRIVGTICLVDAKSESDPFKKRLVLPLDTIFEDPKDKHIPYVEFLKEDIKAPPSSNLSASYVRNPPKTNISVEYRRFNLSGHVVEIANIVPDEFNVWSSYDEHIPKMTNVADQLDPAPRDECFVLPPDPALFGGFLDVSYGTLKSGPLDEIRTEFELLDETVVYTIHSARFSELLFRVEPPILVHFHKDGQTTTVELDPETTDVITIGNQPLDMISGEGQEDVKHHFRLYYELADLANKPMDPPLPRVVAAIVNGCANTNWP